MRRAVALHGRNKTLRKHRRGRRPGRAIRAIKADFVIVDAPGAMGAAFGAAIAVCDLALVPSSATVLDVRGSTEAVELVRQRRRASGKPKPDIPIVPARIDRR